MEKRYQVFISSTFMDLKNARQEVSQALLRADCFPAGMELFPAADEEQFEFIKTIIDQSDYYILISAGRYGSIHPETGLSYTEMEYDYAVEIGIPVIRLLHKNPKSVADENDEKLVKLLIFQSKLRNGRMVAFWETPSELGREAAFALLEIKKTKPTIGWVRADGKASQEAELEIFRLKEEITQYSVETSEPTLDQRLSYQLPVTTALAEATGEIGDQSPKDYLDDLLADIEHSIDRLAIRDVADLVDYLVSGNSTEIRERRARELVDALILDRVLSILGSSRLSIPPFGRAIMAKSRLSRTIGVLSS
ncbi:MAG: hypothetical protein ACI9KK_000262 [Ascidiaceihabitans sp.]|jgi:uncharacterized protein (UPF0297 family)